MAGIGGGELIFWSTSAVVLPFVLHPPGMAEQFWLVKQEPEAYAWSRFVADGVTAWTGVRNHQARNNLRAMRVGDRVLYYHSVTDKAVVGIARVRRVAYPDPTASEGDWSCVDLEPVAPLVEPVPLAVLKEDPATAGMALIRQSRLSVTPLTRVELEGVLRLGKAPAALRARVLGPG